MPNLFNDKDAKAAEAKRQKDKKASEWSRKTSKIKVEEAKKAAVADTTKALTEAMAKLVETPNDGEDGRGIARVKIKDNFISVVFTDGEEQYAGKIDVPEPIKGDPGISIKGEPGVNIKGDAGVGIKDVKVVKNEIQITFTDGKTTTIGTIDVPIPKKALNGKDGKGIKDLSIKHDDLIITYTDGTTQKLKLPKGGDGRGFGYVPGYGTANLAFKTIVVAGQDSVVSDSPNDTLTLVAGSNVTITTDAATKTITITAAGGSVAVTTYNFTGDNSTTSFAATYTVGNVLVYMDGSLMLDSDMTISSGTAVVFDTAPYTGANIVIKAL